jgi:putative ABC transport system permease protein
MPEPFSRGLYVARRNYLEWKRQSTVFADMAAFREITLNEGGADRAERVSTGFASANLLPMLGARARLGRLFAAGEERKGNDLVAVLTDAYFERRFHRDPGALGKSVTLGGTAYAVVGVLPPKFHLPATWEGSNQLRPDVWVPLSRLWNSEDDEIQRQLHVPARLRRGVSLAQARTEMAAIAERLRQADPKLNEGWTTSVFSFEAEDAAPELRRALYVLLAAVGFLLLIACANLANLTLARATARSREIAVRLALGAGRGRIVVQLLVESLLVAIAGAGLGLLLAHWCVRLMLALEPPDIQRPELIAINAAVFAFAAAAAVLTALLFGLAPALAAARADLNSALKTGGGWSAAPARVRTRQGLIAVEVALALVLLAGAGLMIRSFHHLVSVGIGFETAHLAVADVELPQARYRDGASQARFFRKLIDRVRSLAGVQGAAVVDNLPLHSVSFFNFYFAGRPDPPPNALPMADTARVSPAYFRVMGLGLQAGRFFTEADLAASEHHGDGVVVVNKAFATKFFSGEDPLGKRLQKPDRKQAFQIIGVVSDYRPLGVEGGTRPQIFWPDLKLGNATLVVRAAGAPESLGRTIPTAVSSIDKEIVVNAKTMSYHVDQWQSQRRFNTLLLSIFAALAVVLAMMGIYGVLATLVASRVREIGIRMALGARPVEIRKLVLRQSMVPVAIGVVVGTAGALALSRFLEGLLYEVRSRDPLTLLAAAAAILLVSPAAVYIPMRHATRVECVVALREE